MYVMEINSLILYGIEVIAISISTQFSPVNGLESESERKVHWSLITYPITAGEDVKLTCVVRNKNMPCSNRSNRMWEGGPEGKLLLLKGIPSNPEKYREESYNRCTNFSLVIRKVTEHDMNCKYRCSFGFEESKQTELAINETSFISKPNEYSYHSLTINESAIDVTIQFYKVYPYPKCKMRSVMVPNADILISNRTMNGMYYDVRLHATHALQGTCRYHWQFFTVSVHCSLLGFTILDFSENLNCSEKQFDDDNRVKKDPFLSQKYSFIYVIAAVVVVLVTIYVYLICRIGFKRRTVSNNGRDKNIPMENPLLQTTERAESYSDRSAL